MSEVRTIVQLDHLLDSVVVHRRASHLWRHLSMVAEAAMQRQRTVSRTTQPSRAGWQPEWRSKIIKQTIRFCTVKPFVFIVITEQKTMLLKLMQLLCYTFVFQDICCVICGDVLSTWPMTFVNPHRHSCLGYSSGFLHLSFHFKEE